MGLNLPKLPTLVSRMGGMYGLNALLEFNHSPKCLVVAPVLTVSIMFFYAYAALLHSNKALKWFLGRLKLFVAFCDL